MIPPVRSHVPSASGHRKSDRELADSCAISSHLLLFPPQEKLSLGLKPVIERPAALPLAFEIQLVGPLSNVVLRWWLPPSVFFHGHLFVGEAHAC
jgi:hypothetical protein